MEPTPNTKHRAEQSNQGKTTAKNTRPRKPATTSKKQTKGKKHGTQIGDQTKHETNENELKVRVHLPSLRIDTQVQSGQDLCHLWVAFYVHACSSR